MYKPAKGKSPSGASLRLRPEDILATKGADITELGLGVIGTRSDKIVSD